MISVLMSWCYRMVRDNLHKTEVKNKKPSGSADAQTQTEAPEEPVEPEQTQTPESHNRAERELDFLQWKKHCFEEEPESWPKVSTRSVGGSISEPVIQLAVHDCGHQ